MPTPTTRKLPSSYSPAAKSRRLLPKLVLAGLWAPLTVSTPALASESQESVLVEVQHVRDARGHVLVALCTEKTFLTASCPYHGAVPSAAGTVVVRIDGVPPGTYSAQAFQDDNDSKTLERTFFGLPSKGMGFSRDARMRFGPPRSTTPLLRSRTARPPLSSRCITTEMAPFDGAPATPLQSSHLAEPRAARREAQDLTPVLWEVIDRVVAAAVVAGPVRPIIEVALTGACRTSLWPALLRVVDELVTNSVEHAFADHERGRIIVSIDGRHGPGVVVSVSDTGPGFRQDSTLEGNGMRLLGVLGDVSVTCADGCCTVSCDIPSRRKWPAIVDRTYPAVSQ